MSYLIVQTFVLLLAAALLGALLAWYLTRMVAANDRAGLHARLRAAEREAGALQERLSEGERTRESLAARLAEAQDALAACQAQCAELAAEAAEAAEAPVSLPAADPEMQEGIRPPSVQPDDGGDDLQQIKGIGPKIAATLGQLGIGRFDQIAAWTPEHVAWVNAHLRFKGRVEREEWIAQARNLAAQSAGD